MTQGPLPDELTHSASEHAVRRVFQVVGLPAVVAVVDYLAIAWSKQTHWSAWSYAVLMPLLVGQVALLAYWSAKRVEPEALRWFVYAWSLVLVDLVVFSAMLDTPRDSWNPGLSSLGYALLAAQISGLIVWLALGSASWPWRMAAFLVVASTLAVLLERVAVAHGNWRAYVWPAILLSQTAAVLLLSILARAFRIRIQASGPVASGQSVPTLRFGLQHLLIWTTSICLVLVVLRGLDVFILESFQTQELYPVGELGVNLALGAAVAVWAALGGGHWTLRVFVLGIVAAGSGWGLTSTGEGWATALGNSSTSLVHVVSNMGNYCFVWTALSMCFLAAILLFFRAQGHRLTRGDRAG